MGRAPCCDKQGLKKGPWTPHEDDILISYISKNGHGSWRSLPKLAGLLRCGKSCRLRWTNYLRPDIKRGPFTAEEEKLVIQLHGILGNRWAAIASQLAGRTDNEIKNLWNTHLKKRLLCLGLDPNTHEPLSIPSSGLPAMPPPSTSARHMAQWETARLEAEARHSRDPLLFTNHNPPHLRPDTDHFLRLWNSAVGDSFRNPGRPPARNSPGSQSSSSSAKYGSVSGRQPEGEPEVGLQIGADESTCWAGTDSSGSNDLGGESAADTALQLLLDFPLGSDMSFLEEDISEYLFSCQHKSV